MTLEELKARYEFYVEASRIQLKQAKYFDSDTTNIEETLAENEAVLALIEEKEKRLN